MTTVTNARKRRIFLDQDNCIADFQKEFQNRFNIADQHFAQGVFSGGNDEFWKIFDSNSENFFRDIPPFEGTRDFVEEVFRLSDQYNYGVEILTALPKKSIYAKAEREKNEWVLSQRFSRPLKVNTGPYAIHKQNFARIGDILIDDSQMNISQWIDKGCVGILHKSFEESLNELKTALAIADVNAVTFYRK